MKIYPIKYKDMNVKYLMALFNQKNLNKEEISKVLLKKLEMVKLTDLLKRWNKEKNQTLKNRFLYKVSSIDAICILINSYNEQIKQCAYQKYHELLDAYLDAFENEDYKLYLNEGDDSDIDFDSIKIIKYKKGIRK